MRTSSLAFTETTANDHAIIQDSRGMVVINLKSIFDAAHKEEDLQGRFHQLINQAYSLQATVNAITAEINSNNLTVLEAAHETAVGEARASMDNYYTAKNQELRYKNAEIRANDEFANAQRRLSALKNSEPRSALFPTKAEIQKWKDSVAAAETTVTEKQEEVERTARELQSYYAGVEQFAISFNAASKRESDIRHKLNSLKGIVGNHTSIENGLPGQ